MIPMNAFNREPEELVRAQMAAVERVLRSGWWILGKEVETFEAEWSQRTGSGYTVGVGNGMDALEIGLRCLPIGKGDEVITTSMTAFATVLAILRAGAVPVLADIDPETAILSLESVQRCISPKTKAVIVVHLYGQAAPLDKLADLCAARKIHLIEDCAQAAGAKFRNKPVGTVGSFSGWSFYSTKNLGAIGDGGALSTNDPFIAQKARQLRNYGQQERYHHPQEGLNSRLDEVQAAILKVRMSHLDTWNARRRGIASRYSSAIRHPLVRPLPMPEDISAHVHHLYVVMSPERDALAGHLKTKAVETLIHYPVPVHFQQPCKTLRRDPEGLKITERHAQTCLSLPCNPFLTDDEVSRVIAAVNEFKK